MYRYIIQHSTASPVDQCTRQLEGWAIIFVFTLNSFIPSRAGVPEPLEKKTEVGAAETKNTGADAEALSHKTKILRLLYQLLEDKKHKEIVNLLFYYSKKKIGPTFVAFFAVLH